MREEPILGEVSRFTQHEGKRALLERLDGTSEAFNYQLSSNEVIITHEDIKTGNMEKVLGFLIETARKFAQSQVTQMISKINKATAKTGNIIQMQGGFTKEAYLAALSMIPVDFDPQTLEPLDHRKFLAPREQVGELRKKLQEWRADPTFEVAIRSIIDRQREEWRDRESCRKLVD